MRIAVTGASGFVGLPVCATLAAAGHAVRAIVRARQAPPELVAAEMLTGCDLAEAAACEAAAAGVDVIVHLAARAHVMSDDPQTSDALYSLANVVVTEMLARAAIRHGVKRFVYVSSIKVNGERTKDRPFTAADAPAPEDSYGRSKRDAEKVLDEIATASSMETVIVRPPLLYGPRMRGNMLRLFDIVNRGVPIPLASIRNSRDILFVGNLAALVETLIRHPAAAGRVFLARDGVALSTPALIDAIAEALGRKPWCVPFPIGAIRAAAQLAGVGAAAARLLDDLRVDDTETRQVLGWQSPFAQAEAFAETARWFKASTS